MRVAVAGLGAVGRELVRVLTEERDEGRAQVVAVAARDTARATRTLAELGCDAAVVGLHELGETADVVVEALPPALLADVAGPALDLGRDVVVLSCGALLTHWDLVARARAGGGRLHVPSGAIAGLDGIQAAAQGPVTSVRITTRKPVASLLGSDVVRDEHPDLAATRVAVRLFAGSARDAIARFPTNVNVAVAVSLAGIGPDRTQVEVWADPDVTRNTHLVEVDAAAARLAITVENVPSENPRTGRLTAASVLALLRKLEAPLRIGT